MERPDFEQWKPREVSRLLALVETERRYYQEMIAALPAPVAVLTSRLEVASSNRAFRRMTGLRNEELRGRAIADILGDVTLADKIESNRSESAPTAFAVSFKDKNYQAAAISIRNWEDELESETLLFLEGASGAFAAVPAKSEPTPILAAPKAPIEPTEPEDAISTMPAIVWQAELPGYRFLSVLGARAILGYPAAHWKTMVDFISQRIFQDDRAHVMALYDAIAQTGGEASAEFRAISANGVPVWCRETVRAQDGLMTGVLTAIGRRKQIESELVTAGRIDAIHGLSSRLAHDLNNPLMIVTGYAEEILNTLEESDPSRGDVQQILDATERMTEIAGDLLDFTRPKAKAQGRVNVRELMTTLDEPLRNLAGRNIQVHKPTDHAVWAMADNDQLEDCVLALAVAAVENTQGNQGLTISLQTDLIAEHTDPAPIAPGVYTRFDLFAAGNPADVFAGAFEHFLPAKSGSKTGQALARAYAIVREWGGDILYTSQPEVGTAFVMLLPYAEPERSNVMRMPTSQAPSHVDEGHAEPTHVQEPAAPAPEPILGTILVVEDEAGIRGLVSKILKRERYAILEAESAEQALDIVKERGNPDLLLTDIMLPGMNGLQLASTIRQSHPTQKVVYVSGYAGDEAAYGELPPGSRFLAKPFTLGALTAAVRETLHPEA